MERTWKSSGIQNNLLNHKALSNYPIFLTLFKKKTLDFANIKIVTVFYT